MSNSPCLNYLVRRFVQTYEARLRVAVCFGAFRVIHGSAGPT